MMRHLFIAELAVVSGGYEEEPPDGWPVDPVNVQGIPTIEDMLYADLSFITDVYYDGGGGGGGGGISVAEAVERAICALSHAVEDLDGFFFGAKDGDGLDEALRLLTLASAALGGIGVAAVLTKGVLNSTAVMNSLAGLVGDDIALRLPGIFGAVAVAIGGTAATGVAVEKILEALTSGDPPPGC